MTEPQNNHKKFSNFGFQQVDPISKQNLVNKVFSDVSNKYDLMNDIMSLGLHRFWKDEFCKQIPVLDSKILDVAGGTGDIALRLLDKAKSKGNNLQITICDINQDMLNIAVDKAIDSNILQGVEYICADAENLPFEDNMFDYYTIAFGIRNVKHIEKALSEAYRVLKPSGKFLCLEFSKVDCELLAKLYNFYSFNILPKFGKIIANNSGAYQYLAESIELFPAQDEFSTMIKQAGFSDVNYTNMTFGVVAIHSAFKL